MMLLDSQDVATGEEVIRGVCDGLQLLVRPGSTVQA